MNLPGRLAATTLGDLLGRLHRARADGVLELIERSGCTAGRAHRIYFERGLIDDVETGMGTPRLGELLIRHGVLAPESLLALSPRLLGGAARVGELVIAERLAPHAAVVRALREQLRARLEALFGLRDALVRFHPRRPRSRTSPAPEPLEAADFLHGRARARSGSARSSEVAPPSEPRARALSALGLDPRADVQAVRRAFRARARELHPDRYPHASPAERSHLLQRFAELSAAYHELVRTSSGSSERSSRSTSGSASMSRASP
ncbi:MAG TPA: DUF4388 domain-containing protein [Polyangiaceae bacterium]|nr:DUF4388 domain-containing protein [Polyangiaceae bacterium]